MWWCFVFVCFIPPHNRGPRIYLEVKTFIFRMVQSTWSCVVYVLQFGKLMQNTEALGRHLHLTNLLFLSQTHIFYTTNINKCIRLYTNNSETNKPTSIQTGNTYMKTFLENGSLKL